MSRVPGYSELSPLYVENLQRPDKDRMPTYHEVKPYGWVEGFLVRLATPLANMDASAPPLTFDLRVARSTVDGSQQFEYDVQLLARSVADLDGTPPSIRGFYPGAPLLFPFGGRY